MDKKYDNLPTFEHLGYLESVTPADLKKANIDGTRQVVAVAEALEVKCLQYTSSLAVE